VAVDKLASSIGQELVRNYESASYAQRLFHNLVDHFTPSTTADINATEIL